MNWGADALLNGQMSKEQINKWIDESLSQWTNRKKNKFMDAECVDGLIDGE